MIEKLLIELGCYPGIGETDSELLSILIKDAQNDIKMYINDETPGDLPEKYWRHIKELVLCRFNRLGAEGISSTSQSGISENYTSNIPDELRSKLRRIRKIPR